MKPHRTSPRLLEARHAELLGRIGRLEEQLAAKDRQLAQKDERIAALEKENAQLHEALAKARKNSRNSSKPPSSDIVKPPSKTRGRKPGKIGGQKGHPRHLRPEFPPDQIDQTITYHLERCPVDGSHQLIPTDQVQTSLQQVELVEKPLRVTEHLGCLDWCVGCGCYHAAPLPEAVRAAGLFGPRLSSFAVFLKGRLRSSYTGIQSCLDEVMGLKVSRGYLAKRLGKSAEAFEAPCRELIEILPKQPELNVDETGHKENGKRLWTWCFRAPDFTVFQIADRGAGILYDLLGPEFEGILGCDCYGAYLKYARECGVELQLCMAHLIREVRYMSQHPDPYVRRYGQGLLESLKGAFQVYHRKERLRPDRFAAEMIQAEDRIWEAALAPRASPRKFGGPEPHRLIENMVRRFFDQGENYFRFIDWPGVEPTNNRAEQAIRTVVMDRTMTQGTRGPRGRRICEGLWTVMATCRQQQRSAYQWIHQALTAHFNNQPPPSLILDFE